MKVQMLILKHRTEWQQGPTLTFFSPHDKKIKIKIMLWNIRSKKYFPFPPQKNPQNKHISLPKPRQPESTSPDWQKASPPSPSRARISFFFSINVFPSIIPHFRHWNKRSKKSLYTIHTESYILKSLSFNKNELNLKQNARCYTFLSTEDLLFIKKINKREIIRLSLRLQTENKLIRTILTMELASGNHRRQLSFVS